MRRVRFFFGLALAISVAWGGVTLVKAMGDMELFRVTGFRLQGARYLTLAAAVEAAAVPAGASIWDDSDPWVAGLMAHPLVREARVGRRPPGTLVLKVVEREPVALLPTPTLEPIDETGLLLPVDPALHQLDLPVIEPATVGRQGRSHEAHLPAEVRALAREVVWLAETDPQFFSMLSDVARGPQGSVVANAGDPGVAFHYRPPLTQGRLRVGMRVLDDALRRWGEAPAAIDLRFADQVVVRFERGSQVR